MLDNKNVLARHLRYYLKSLGIKRINSKGKVNLIFIST